MRLDWSVSLCLWLAKICVTVASTDLLLDQSATRRPATVVLDNPATTVGKVFACQGCRDCPPILLRELGRLALGHTAMDM